ncbi:MAG: bifunctional methylenetetrahydrofolate dehydrogenase/methenyltetrahydrofolate cyclohydrolase FolD [Myxococcales bacterium]|nr:bifunctional methylenetetrahydrofolate dehydrogenase/methenyltetrahydrofolate cyclohydrolase FolD [Myxococcales bacterium]
MATHLDGKRVAEQVKASVADRVSQLKTVGVTPGLAVIQVGADPASSVYVRNKRRTCELLGFQSIAHDLPEATSETKLLQLIQHLNDDSQVHGILVQLPLPSGISPDKVMESINPTKDVDGFHPYNVGRLALGKPTLVPCTPLGIMRMLEYYHIVPAGKHAVVIGRSNTVGRPMAQLLLAADATVTVVHSKTPDAQSISREADILVVAMGRRQVVNRDWVKSGSVVVDVGIHRLDTGGLVGDCDFASVRDVASYLTPVPGGVGPMTIAMLMENTVRATETIVNRLDVSGSPENQR